MAKKAKLLQKLGESMKDIKIDVEDLSIDVLNEFKIHINDNIIDYRGDTSYQSIVNIVMISFLALLGNSDEWTKIYEFGIIHKEWLSKFLDLEYGIPSISTIRKTMALIDPNELEKICVDFIIKKVEELQTLVSTIVENEKQKEQIKQEEKDIISYDGKVCRGSKRDNTNNGEIKPVNAMTAYNSTKDLCLATKFIEDKTNEIPTGPELIKLLDLTNTISTFDALNTQTKTIDAIVDKGGDYVAALKGNQHNFYNDVVDYFNDKSLFKEAYDICHFEETEKAHNQIEKRTYVMTNDISWLSGEKWQKLKSIGLCKKECIKDDKTIVEIRYYITSLTIDDIKDFARAVRDEWGIENNLHWFLDTVFREDANKTMNKNAQANLNILRKLCLTILKLVKPLYNKSLELIRYRIGQNFEEEIKNVFQYLNIAELKKIIEQSQ